MAALATLALSFIARLTNYIRASYPCLAIETSEEPRVLSDVQAAVKTAKRGLATWSITEGVRVILPILKPIADTQDPTAALQALAGLRETVIVLRDAQALPFDRDPMLARLLRDLIVGAPALRSNVILVGPRFQPYASIEKLVTMMEYSLPSKDDLARVAVGIAESCGMDSYKPTDAILRALGGLSMTESENALALSFIEAGKFDTGIIYREKIAAVKRGGKLEIVESDPRGLDAIGGLKTLKTWLCDRREAYSPEAREYGLPDPKGVLLIGCPGTGKSLAAKILGIILGVPTLRLDIGAMFNSLVGQSESNLREALAQAEAMSPCVLWVDEIDKALAGSNGGANDGGVTRRLFGTLLTWLQEHKGSVFMFATANGVASLPPEFFRKGRWDEIFALDLPTLAERIEIVRVQVKKHVKSDKARAVLALDEIKIAQACEGFTGSEIEAAVVGGLFTAFGDGKRLIASADVIGEAGKVVPLSVMAKDQIDSIRAWAKANARNAGESEVEATKSVRAIG